MTSETKADAAVRHVPDKPVRPPMHRNMHELSARSAGTIGLMPIFPQYLHDNAIVPCLSVSFGREDFVEFQFFHDNDVDETILCLAAEGSSIKSGDFIKLSNIHGVNSFLNDPRDPSSFSVGIITVRMQPKPVQREAMTARCDKCGEKVFELTFNVKEPPHKEGHIVHHGYFPEFYAIRYYDIWAEEYNSDVKNRTCPSCGHVHPPFPREQMAWRLSSENYNIANQLVEIAKTMERNAYEKESAS